MVTNLCSCIIVLAFAVATYAGGDPDFVGMQKHIDKQKHEMLKNKIIVGAADETLEILLKNKSPMILSWIQKRDLLNKSEDQLVREWRTYYIDEFFMKGYPFKGLKNSDTLNVEFEKFADSLNKKYFTKSYRKKQSEQFALVKKQALATVSSMSLSVENKKKVSDIISSVDLYWFDQFKDSNYASKPAEFLNWGVAFDPKSKMINIGLEIFKYSDEQTLLAVYAHEIGHAFDSCRWSAFYSGAWPFAKVGECLREQGSVHALKRDDSLLEKILKSNPEKKSEIDELKKLSTCNSSQYPPLGVQADQLPEAFADWFSAEVLASLLTEFKKIRQDLAEDMDLRAGSSYPKNSDRLNKIYLAQPKIKAKLKNENQVRYCEL